MHVCMKESERRYSRTQALRNIDAAISNSLNLQLTLKIILGEVVTQLGVDASDILLVTPHTQMLELASSYGFRFEEKVRNFSIHVGDGMVGKLALKREMLQIQHLEQQEDILLRRKIFENEGFVTYFGIPLLAKGTLVGVLEVFQRSQLEPDSEWVEFLEALGGQAAIAIDNTTLFNDLQRSNFELTLTYDRTLEGWSAALDLRDRETEGHTQRVTETTLKLAKVMGLSEQELVHIRRGALLHDIGKMGIPDEILLKPDKLTEEEWEIMRRHPVYAFELLKPIAYLQPALDIPYCHHEKWDGTGYPRALKGGEIPFAARIFTVVDVWDALLSDRPYRKGWPKEKVLEYIRSLSGIQFDPKVVEAFLNMQRQEEPLMTSL